MNNHNEHNNITKNINSNTTIQNSPKNTTSEHIIENNEANKKKDKFFMFRLKSALELGMR